MINLFIIWPLKIIWKLGFWAIVITLLIYFILYGISPNLVPINFVGLLLAAIGTTFFYLMSFIPIIKVPVKEGYKYVLVKDKEKLVERSFWITIRVILFILALAIDITAIVLLFYVQPTSLFFHYEQVIFGLLISLGAWVGIRNFVLPFLPKK